MEDANLADWLRSYAGPQLVFVDPAADSGEVERYDNIYDVLIKI